MNNDKKIKSFTDLNAWKESHKLVVAIYKETENFPNKEIFGLTNQLRRACVSISSNIAEGFGRKTYKEKTQFYYQAKGSLMEVKNQLLIAKDVNYLKKYIFSKLAEQANTADSLLQGLINKTKSFINHKS